MCLVGVVVRRYIDFLILLIPTPYVSALFCRRILHFFCFSFLFQYIFIIYFIIFSRNVNKTIGVPRKPFEGLHIMLKHKQTYAKLHKHAKVKIIKCWSSGVGTLEVSGGIYNTAGFLQRDSWRKDTNIITSKTQSLGSLA